MHAAGLHAAAGLRLTFMASTLDVRFLYQPPLVQLSHPKAEGITEGKGKLNTDSGNTWGWGGRAYVLWNRIASAKPFPLLGAASVAGVDAAGTATAGLLATASSTPRLIV